MRVLPNQIEIMSFPGIDRSVSKQDLKKLVFVPRRYRNRRLGEFLKELELTEGRGTGLPKMLQELKKNRSPKPIFHTDNDRTFTTIIFPIHPLFLKKAESWAESGAESWAIKLLLLIQKGPMSKSEIAQQLGRNTVTGALNRLIKDLHHKGLVEYTIPSKQSSRLQKYRITPKGIFYLKNKL